MNGKEQPRARQVGSGPEQRVPDRFSCDLFRSRGGKRRDRSVTGATA